MARVIRQVTSSAIASAILSQGKKGEALQDAYEGLFGPQPKNAAMALMINANLNVLRKKFVGQIADTGQELAMRRVIALLNDQLYSLFPQFFKHSSAYGYEMPLHWPSRPLWERAGQDCGTGAVSNSGQSTSQPMIYLYLPQ